MNGSEYVVLWQRQSVTQLLGTRVSRDGAAIDSQPIAMTMPYPAETYYTKQTAFPAVNWTGSEYLVTWTYAVSAYIPLFPDPPPILELHARRFDRNLTAVSAESVIATPAYLSNSAWNGSEALVIYNVHRVVRAMRLRADGSVIASNDLFESTAAYAQYLTAVWDGSQWIATYGPYVLHIRADGTLLTREFLGDDVDASAVTQLHGAPVLVFRRFGSSPQVYLRTPIPQRRRAAQ